MKKRKRPSSHRIDRVKRDWEISEHLHNNFDDYERLGLGFKQAQNFVATFRILSKYGCNSSTAFQQTKMRLVRAIINKENFNFIRNISLQYTCVQIEADLHKSKIITELMLHLRRRSSKSIKQKLQSNETERSKMSIFHAIANDENFDFLRTVYQKYTRYQIESDLRNSKIISALILYLRGCASKGGYRYET